MKTITKIFLIIISIFVGFWGCKKDYTIDTKVLVEIELVDSNKVVFRVSGDKYEYLYTVIGVCYSEETELPTINDSYIKLNNNQNTSYDYYDGEYYYNGNNTVYNLKEGVTYYWRSFVQNGNEIVYGKVQTFFTKVAEISVWEIGYPVAANVIATLRSNGILTISGSGAMADYNYTYLGSDAPWNNYVSKMTKLIIEEGVTNIGNYAFYYYNYSNGYGYEFIGNLTIPNSVTTIGQYAFRGCNGFTGNLTIPNSVTNIGDGAFQNCSGFTGTLIIPNSVKTIGDWAFQKCSGLNTVNFNAINCTTIGSSAWCTSLTTLNIGNQVTNIPNYAFYGCSGFTDLTIGNSVTTIGERAFFACSGFTGYLTIPNSVTTIGEEAFIGCSGFTGNLTIPNSVKTIGEEAFYYCSGLTSLTIGNSVTTIDYSAFRDCSGLQTVNFNAINCTNMGGEVWSGCAALTTLNIGNQVQTIPYGAFHNCRFTGTLTIPNSVTSIGSSAFAGCSGFTGNLTIGNSVTNIENGAFSGCKGFTGNLIIPNSVTTIGDQAFRECKGFTDITVSWANPISVDYSVFYNINRSNVKLHVPSGTKSLYQSAPVWQEFNIVED